LGQSNEDPNDDEEKLVGQQSDSMSYIYIYISKDMCFSFMEIYEVYTIQYE
jgi:hypothetical protein